MDPSRVDQQLAAGSHFSILLHNLSVKSCWKVILNQQCEQFLSFLTLFLPQGMEQLRDVRATLSFQFFLFCGWVFSFFLMIEAKLCLGPQMLEWLDIFQMFCVIRISGKTKDFLDKTAEGCRLLQETRWCCGTVKKGVTEFRPLVLLVILTCGRIALGGGGLFFSCRFSTVLLASAVSAALWASTPFVRLFKLVCPKKNSNMAWKFPHQVLSFPKRRWHQETVLTCASAALCFMVTSAQKSFASSAYVWHQGVVYSSSTHFNVIHRLHLRLNNASVLSD